MDPGVKLSYDFKTARDLHDRSDIPPAPRAAVEAAPPIRFDLQSVEDETWTTKKGLPRGRSRSRSAILSWISSALLPHSLSCAAHPASFCATSVSATFERG